MTTADTGSAELHPLGTGRNHRWWVGASEVDMAEAAPAPRRLTLAALPQRVTLDLTAPC